MKKNMKKNVVIFSVIVIFFVMFFTRYYIINRDIPKKYSLDEYTTNEEIELDNLSLKINEFNVDKTSLEEKKGLDIILNVTIKNRSNNIQNVSSLIQYSKLAVGNYYQDYCNPIGELKKVGNLRPNDDVTIDLKYTLFLRDVSNFIGKNEYKFYIAKTLYKDEIDSKFKTGTLYGKYVNLGGGKCEG